MTLFNTILTDVNNFMYQNILIILLLVLGIYFCVRTGFVQFRMFGHSLKLILEKGTPGKQQKPGISSFQALMVSTASRVGVGNIAGVATAIAVGGAGAVFWMWITALIGSPSAFVESSLAQLYKIKDQDEFRGGPSYYIEKALGCRPLGILFSLMLIACFAFGFNTLQANNIVSGISYYFGGSYSSPAIPALIGLILAGLTAFTIFGGQQKIAFMSSVIVPVMALVYIVLGLFMVFSNLPALPSIFASIFTQAFDVSAIFGGFTGSCVMLGIKRGLFSNEAGMGSSPNAAATADTNHPAKQGLVQILSVFIDTMLICSTTAFMILSSGVDTEGMQAMPLVQAAVGSRFGELGILFITISIFFFAFTSIIGNYYYTESNMYYIFNRHISLTPFRITAVAAVFLGCLAGYDLAWNLADLLMGLMTLVNVTALFLLGNTAMRLLKDYERKRAMGTSITFRAKDIGIDNTDYWK